MATIFWLPSALIVTPPQAITSRSGPADGFIGGDCHVGNGNGDCGGNGGGFGYFDLQRCHHPKRTPHSFPLHQRQGRCWPDKNPSKDCTLSLPPLRSLAHPVTECWFFQGVAFGELEGVKQPETISPPLLLFLSPPLFDFSPHPVLRRGILQCCGSALEHPGPWIDQLGNRKCGES